MKWPASLTLVRHCESAFNELQNKRKRDPLWREFIKEYEKNFRSMETKALAEILLGRYPQVYSEYATPPTEVGRMQARKTSVWLKDQIQRPDVVITSTYLRCRQTFEEMKAVWPELGETPYFTDARLKERSVGLQLLFGNWRLFYVFHPEQKTFYDRAGGYYHYRFPQGEDMDDVRLRLLSWFNTLTREFAEKHILVVTHHVTILAIRANLERMTPEQFVELDNSNPPKNSSVTIYRGHPELGSDGKLILERYNYLPQN